MNARSSPRMYVLDEEYRMILAPASAPDDPLNDLYAADSRTDALPPAVEDTIRRMTAGWGRHCAPVPCLAISNGLRITVSPLHGPVGPHYAVVIEREKVDPMLPMWQQRASA